MSPRQFAAAVARRLGLKIAPPIRPSATPRRAQLNMTPLEDRTVPTAVVTVEKIADVIEGDNTGIFRLTRTETSGALNVRIAFSGDATPGSDFEPSNTIVTEFGTFVT